MAEATNPPTTRQARIRALADEVVGAHAGLYVLEVSVRGTRGSHVVDVYVDGEQDVSLDSITDISRELGFLLETEDLFEKKYQLNVSSPGVDRPLSDPRQYRKNVGRELVVRYETEDGDRKNVAGTLADADDEALTLEVEGDPEPRRIPFDAVRKATVKLPW